MTDTSKLEYFIERKIELYKQADMLETYAQHSYFTPSERKWAKETGGRLPAIDPKKAPPRNYKRIMTTAVLDLTKGQILITDILLEILKSQKQTPPE